MNKLISPWWLRALLILAGVAVVLTSMPGPAQAVPTATAAGCSRSVAQPQGPFRIASDHRTVLNANGSPFISYGTTVPGLSQANFDQNQAGYLTSVVRDKDIPKINATARYWCGNTVRLQVSQYDVTQNSTPNGGSCATGDGQDFLAKALDAEVHAAEKDKLAVVINDQTESDPLKNRELDPTKATFTFWSCVTHHAESWDRSRTYAQDPDVIFDIFNEPRADACTSPHGPYNMLLWRNGGGGPCGSDQPAYQGMDAVAYHLRVDDGAGNLLWVEGPDYGNTLAGMDRGCRPSPSCLITADLGPVVYAFHHPYVATAAGANSSTWWDEFGYLVNRKASTGQAPVVAGEWTNVDAGAATPGKAERPYCWPSAPQSVQRFLNYLTAIGVGMSAYQLSGGYLLKVNGRWTDTTNYTDHPWNDGDCVYSPKGSPPPSPPVLLGAGADVLAWFRQRN